MTAYVTRSVDRRRPWRHVADVALSSNVIAESYPTRAEWLAARRDPSAIGASEVAGVLGVHPHMTPWSLWEMKQVGPVPTDRTDADLALMRRGNEWERVVLAEYGVAAGVRVVDPGEHFGRKGHTVTMHNTAFPWLRSSPDAFAWDGKVLGHVEAKTALDGDAWTRDSGLIVEAWCDGAERIVPPHYAVQAYAQLAVSELPWNDVCVLIPEGGWLAVRWVRMMRDADTQREIIEAAGAWRERHLVGGEAPTLDGSRACNRYLARRFNAPEKRPIRVGTPDEVAMLREIARLRAEVKVAEERIDVIGNTLVAAAGESRIAVASHHGAPYGQAQAKPGSVTIDSARLKQEFPDAYAACKRTGSASVSFATYRFGKEE